MRKALLIGVPLLLICCCVSVVAFFALFGHLESNGVCTYKGPMATVTEGACATNTNTNNNNVDDNTDTDTNDEGDENGNDTVSGNTYTGDNSDLFTFNYDSSVLTLNDTPANPQIYLMLTASNNDNVNITGTSEVIQTTSTQCREFGEGVIDILIDGGRDVDESSFESNIVTLGGKNVCQVYWQANYNGVEMEQHQYVFSDSSRSYIITVTNKIGSTMTSTLDEVVETFRIK